MKVLVSISETPNVASIEVEIRPA